MTTSQSPVRGSANRSMVEHVPYATTGVFGHGPDGWQWLYWGGAEPQETPRVKTGRNVAGNQRGSRPRTLLRLPHSPVRARLSRDRLSAEDTEWTIGHLGDCICSR